MADRNHLDGTRRAFLKEVATYGGAAVLASHFCTSLAHAAPAARAAQGLDWNKQVGLELFTVRDLLEKDFEGTVAKVAGIGYKLVETAVGYNNMEPRAFRAMLDRHGLSMPSSYSGASGTGAELEKQLQGLEIMGVKYTQINAGGGGRRGGPPQPPQSVDSVKRRAEQLNANGKIAQKFGMRVFVHNHTIEFAPLDDGKTTTYDVLLAATDPAVVTMELDVGWASVAGQDIVAMFKKAPGRFELWHVKDMFGIKTMNPKMSQSDRMGAAMIVPIGLGEVDYKTIFANAHIAGLKHYFIEQDNAAAWGDSLAAARVSYQSLTARALVSRMPLAGR